ncbi:MAG TPA: hypothetical protein VHE80_07720 [Acidimicrobiales bacterium]|nr:hypothetical protein [Acidimicrobiales bacterium]
MSEVPEADAVEQAEPVIAPPLPEDPTLARDASEADAVEQAQPVGPAAGKRVPEVLHPDVAEADEIEQGSPVPEDEEYSPPE